MTRSVLLSLKKVRSWVLTLAFALWPTGAVRAEAPASAPPADEERMCAGPDGQLCVRAIEQIQGNLQLTVSATQRSPALRPELYLNNEKLAESAEVSTRRTPIDLMIIVQRTAQIDAAVFAAFKLKAQQLLAAVSAIPESRVALLSYGGPAELPNRSEIFQSLANGESALNSLTRSEEMANALPLFRVLSTAVDRHEAAARRAPRSRHIVLLSDGSDSDHTEEQLEHLYELVLGRALREHLVIHPVIVSKQVPRPPWARLATQTGGVLGSKVDSADALKLSVEKIIASIRGEERLSFTLPSEQPAREAQVSLVLKRDEQTLVFFYPVMPVPLSPTRVPSVLMVSLMLMLAILMGVLSRRAQSTAGGAFPVGNEVGVSSIVNKRGGSTLLAAYALPQPLTPLGRLRDRVSRVLSLRGSGSVAWLVAADGVLCNKTYPIHKRPFAIGSDPSCSLIIQQPAGEEGRWSIEQIPDDRGVGGPRPLCWVVRCENKDTPIYVGGQAHNLSYALSDQKRFTVGNRTFVFLEEALT